MKLLMLIVDQARKEELEVILSRAEGVLGFTELAPVTGRGSTGLRLGSRAFPRTSAVIFTIVAPDTQDQVVEHIRTYCNECAEHLKIVAWGVEEVM